MDEKVDIYEAMREFEKRFRMPTLEDRAFLLERGFTEDLQGLWLLEDPIYGELRYHAGRANGGFMWHREMPGHGYLEYHFPFHGSIELTYERVRNGILRVLDPGYAPLPEELEELKRDGYGDDPQLTTWLSFRNEASGDKCLFDDGWGYSRTSFIFANVRYATLADAKLGHRQEMSLVSYSAELK